MNMDFLLTLTFVAWFGLGYWAGKSSKVENHYHIPKVDHFNVYGPTDINKNEMKE